MSLHLAPHGSYCAEGSGKGSSFLPGWGISSLCSPCPSPALYSGGRRGPQWGGGRDWFPPRAPVPLRGTWRFSRLRLLGLYFTTSLGCPGAAVRPGGSRGVASSLLCCPAEQWSSQPLTSVRGSEHSPFGLVGERPEVWLRGASEGAFPEYWDRVPLLLSVGLRHRSSAGSVALRAPAQPQAPAGILAMGAAGREG